MLNFCELNFGLISSMLYFLSKDRELCGVSQVKKQNVMAVFRFWHLGSRFSRMTVLETHLL